MKRKTLALVGGGKLAQIVVRALLTGVLPDYELIGTYSRTFQKAADLADRINTSGLDYSCRPMGSLHDLLALKPDYIVEAASPSALRELALPALKNGSSLVVLSIGALADPTFYGEVAATASENRVRVHLVSGSIGGFDVLRTVSLMEACTATFETEKGPNSLKHTPVYDDALPLAKRRVFEGNATEAIALFPTKVNVAVAASLASVGPEAMNVSVTSVPEYVGDRHRITLQSDQVHAVIDIYSKTSEIAGWSVVNTLRNITSPIVF